MSDSKRATLITVGATKSSNNNVKKTVRLTINLDESNESKYPELNYEELVKAEERKRKEKLENGKTKGLDPFSDNDDDVERVARKFEQKYGGKSTYGKKDRSKINDFADIGAGYDENDSFIDNTDGYDEIIPPDCDTVLGGFYINCGDLEFKNVPENHNALSDGEPKKNKRRISSSSSEESSDSSSESSADEKDTNVIVNGVVSHDTEHRKKKSKKLDKKKPKKKQRTDSSAATSGKQTSDDNIPNDAESPDSRTSDSVASKPAPSSENGPTSDSSRDIEPKPEVNLPPAVSQIVVEVESLIGKYRSETPAISLQTLQTKMEPSLFRLDRVLQKPCAPSAISRIAWTRVAKAMKMSRTALLQKVNQLSGDSQSAPPTTSAQRVPTITSITSVSTTITSNNKRKAPEREDLDVSSMSDEEREKRIVETLKRLKALIDEKTPGMMATYNAECERVQEERKKIQIASANAGAPHVEKRLPKRRFPWCPKSRGLLAMINKLAGNGTSAATILTRRALPLFPPGFVRLPTLLRQADLSKEIKASDLKRQRVGSTSNHIRAPPVTSASASQTFTEPMSFPSSLTVTTFKASPEKNDIAIGTDDKEKKTNTVLGSLINSITVSKDLLIETERLKEDKVDILYIPPNSFGNVTITPVPNQKPEKKASNPIEKQKEPLLRVKSPAALNQMVTKDVKKDKEKPKKVENNNVKENRVISPLHIDTSYQTNKKNPSPREENKTTKNDVGISQKQIEHMRNTESNIPRPALIPVHSPTPTFVKPGNRPLDNKKRKEVQIVSDVDPLGEDKIKEDELVSIEDSDSDIEVIEDKSDSAKKDVPCEKVSDKSGKTDKSGKSEQFDEPTKEDIEATMQNIMEMGHSQETTKLTFGGVISSVKHKSSKVASFDSAFLADRSKNKYAELASLNKTDGCNNSITG